MDQWLVISLRIIHILTGAAWVGGTFLLAGFLIPRARTLGPVIGGAYLNRFLDHPWFSIYISAVEALAVITGLALFWNSSGGLESAWMTSPTGLAFTIGGVAAIAALGIGVPISRSLSKVYYLTDSLDSQSTPGGDQVSAFERHHTKLARLGALDITLLTIAAIAMASAQYLN
jgi:hypothetical protein